LQTVISTSIERDLFAEHHKLTQRTPSCEPTSAPLRDVVYEVVAASPPYAPREGLRGAAAKINEHLSSQVAAILARTPDDAAPQAQNFASEDARTDALVGVLVNRAFNYQSKAQVAPLLPGVREVAARCVREGAPLKVYLDLGGGYHASTDPSYAGGLGFEAGATELLLVRQFVELRERLLKVHAPGVECNVLYDNGTAHYINDIPLSSTASYCRSFRSMLEKLNVSSFIKLAVQTEMTDYPASFRPEKPVPVSDITPAQHENVQRFLGRACDEREARERLGRYAVAEAAWEAQVRPLLAGSVRFLQRASDEYLSFRPFPGGATRVQCGQIGFRLQGEKVVPTLVTTSTHKGCDVVPVPVRLDSVLSRPEPVKKFQGSAFKIA